MKHTRLLKSFQLTIVRLGPGANPLTPELTTTFNMHFLK
jgi:hypothetical protein